jgi:S-DNA-T family DNA segregation ATPase FtsK/SpoIIIE
MNDPWYKRIVAWLKLEKKDKHQESYVEPEPSEIYTNPYKLKSKKGNFRFPLIPDEVSQPIREVYPRIEEKKERESRTIPTETGFKRREVEMKTFYQENGRLKKAEEVPSPVYGFRKPQHRPEAAHNEVVFEKQTEETDPDKGWNGDSAVDYARDTDMMEDKPYSEFSSTAPKATEAGPKMESVVPDVQESNVGLPLVEEIGSASRVAEKVASDPPKTNIIQSEHASPAVKKGVKVPYNVLYFGQRVKEERAGRSDLYQFPKLHFLKPSPPVTQEDQALVQEMVERLENTLLSFNVQASVVGILRGPTVTRIEVQPAPGVKVNRITNLIDDIKLNLAAKEIRIEAPIPGKSAVGIEVPNPVRDPVNIFDIIKSAAFKESASPLTVALGKDIEGNPVVIDLRKMPHGLIAGSTGSGKSVCINSIIISLLYKATPEEVKMILIDPKMVELAPYHDLPHLATPVVTDPKQATMALKWAVDEMDRRYEIFAQHGVRDLERYNELMARTRPDMIKPALPYILIVIDELADLMMVAPGDVEESVARIAQKARACGIHLLLATQRPSVDVITGMIKANIPTRIAFSVSSQIDSRTILDAVGAERLLGRGDMLLLENGSNKAIRLQGNFVSDEEIEAVCQFVRNQRKPNFLFDKETLVSSIQDEVEDDLFHEAVNFVIEQEMASTSALQRKFRIGYNRAARLIDLMEERGIISAALGSKPRNVLIDKKEYEQMIQNQ